VAGGWRILHNEEFHSLYASKNVIGMVKSRRIRWMGHRVGMREIRNAYKIFVRKPEGQKLLGISRRRWEIILEWTLGKKNGEMWTGCI
jgi:hypothetical protein